MPATEVARSASAATRRAGRVRAARIALGLVGLGALALLGREAGALVPRFAAWVEGLGAVGPLVFVAVYALAVVAFVPGSLLTAAAGAMFGLVEGTLWAFLAAVLGSTAAFLIGRTLAREAVARRVAGSPRFAAIDAAVGREGRRIVLLLRLSPVFPFNLLNYALGLTRVRLLDTLVGSVGMLPGTLLYAWSGRLAGEVAAAAAGAETGRGPLSWVVLGVGFLATLLLALVVARIARRALREATDARLA